MACDDAVDEPVVDRLLRAEEAVALHVVVDALDRLAGVVRVELVDLTAKAQDLLPPARSSEPIDIGIPKQIVATSGLMNCIVS